MNKRRRVFIAMEKRVNLSRTVKLELECGSGQARESGSPEQFTDTRPALSMSDTSHRCMSSGGTDEHSTWPSFMRKLFFEKLQHCA